MQVTSQQDFHNSLQDVVVLPPPGLENLTPGGEPLNWGTFGHPELCSRPCVHICKSGGCPMGMTCSYCHLPHRVARVNLDKKQRRVLCQMSDQERLAAFLPVFRQRAAETGLLQKVELVIDMFTAEITEALIQPAPSGMLRGLEKTAARMPLIQLASCCMKELPEPLKEALKQLKAQFPPPEIVAGRSGQSVLL